jgi:hypothetical protein
VWKNAELTHLELTQLVLYRYTLSPELPQAVLPTLSVALSWIPPAETKGTPQFMYENGYVKDYQLPWHINQRRSILRITGCYSAYCCLIHHKCNLRECQSPKWCWKVNEIVPKKCILVSCLWFLPHWTVLPVVSTIRCTRVNWKCLMSSQHHQSMTTLNK